MVSIRCFCGVGEFCRVKSIPRGSFASKNEAPVGAGAAIAKRIPVAAANRICVLEGTDISKLVLQRDPSPKNLEQKLQRKLNETRVCPGRSTSDHAEICIVHRTTCGIRWRKLSPVKQVEELHTKLDAGAPVAIQQKILEGGDIKIIDPIGAQSRIDTWLVAEGEICRCRETCCIEPAVEPSQSTGGSRFMASRHQIGAGAGSEQSCVIGLTVEEYQRESSLKCSYTINAPPPNDGVQTSTHIGKIPFALAKRKVQNVADYQSLRHILRR